MPGVPSQQPRAQVTQVPCSPLSPSPMPKEDDSGYGTFLCVLRTAPDRAGCLHMYPLPVCLHKASDMDRRETMRVAVSMSRLWLLRSGEGETGTDAEKRRRKERSTADRRRGVAPSAQAGHALCSGAGSCCSVQQNQPDVDRRPCVAAACCSEGRLGSPNPVLQLQARGTKGENMEAENRTGARGHMAPLLFDCDLSH